MASKEKNGFKRISKKFLSSFRKEKKLHDISEIQEDHVDKSALNNAVVSELSFSSKPKQGNQNDLKQYKALTLSPYKSSKNHFKRILNRASFSNVRSIAKEHPDVLRNITSPRAGRFDLGGSRCASTDSGIDCSILVSEKGSPEKFVAFTRKEAERLRQEFINESGLETVTEVDSKSSLEDDIEDHAEKIDASIVITKDNVANESLEHQINQTKEHIEVLTELKTVLSGKLKEFDQVKTESPFLDDENYVVMTPPTSNSSRTRIAQGERHGSSSRETESHDTDGDNYFLCMYSNKTDEIKAKETRMRQENNLSFSDCPAPEGEIDHKIVNLIPVQSASVANHKKLPPTPAPDSLFNNENSAFAKSKSLKRSVSFFGKLRNKKKDHQSGSFISKDDCDAVNARSKHSKLKAKSMKKNRSFSFDGEHNISLDYLNCSDVNFKSLDDHTSIVEDIDTIQPVLGNGTIDNEVTKPPPLTQEILNVDIGASPLPRSLTDMTNGICEMTSALCASQANSAESIACICDCKNKKSNSECCEKRKTPSMNDEHEVFKTITMSSRPGLKIDNCQLKHDARIEKQTIINNQGKVKKSYDNKKPDSVEMLNKSTRDKELLNRSLMDKEMLHNSSVMAREMLDKSIRDREMMNISVRDVDTESLYVNVDQRLDKLDDSYTDSEGCGCCDCCSQGCDCSHSDTDCSDPNCAECISAFIARRKYLPSSYDGLSEMNGVCLDKSVREPYPNWVNSSDDQTSGSSARSSPNEDLSTSNKQVDDHSPEPVRITKFNSSPNSINSFNMDSSFSVSFREVDFENGEVMYKLDNSLNGSLLSVERQTSPTSGPTAKKPYLNSSITPAPSPSVPHAVNPNMNRRHKSETPQSMLRNNQRSRVSDHINLSLPMNSSIVKNQEIDETAEDPYVAIGVSDSPLNLTFSDMYNKSNGNTQCDHYDKLSNRSSRNGRRKGPDLIRGQLSRSSLLIRSLNESQMLQNDEELRSGKYNQRPKSVSFNQSLNESILYNHNRNERDTRSAHRDDSTQRGSFSKGHLSRSFSGGMNLNSTMLNESFMDSSLLAGSNSPLDLSMSRPRAHREYMSPRPLDLSMSRVTNPVHRTNKQAKWVDRHVGQIYSPAKHVLYKNQGLSEKDLCKQILDLYVSDAEESGYEPQSMFDTTMDSSVIGGMGRGINAEDSILQYGTYLAPRNVVKETNVDDFTTTVRTCYTGEAKTRKLPADCYDLTKPDDRRREKKSDRQKRDKTGSRGGDGNGSRIKEKSREPPSILNRSVEHIYEEIPSYTMKKSVLKDRTNMMKKPSSLKQISSTQPQGEVDKKEWKKNRRDVKEMSDKSFDQLTMLHTARNGQRKVKCLSMDESIHVVKHYPPPKEASRISWGQNLSEMELWRHTPKKSPVKTTPILAQKENTYPYEDDTPSPIVLTKMRKPKSFNQKYKNWPWS